METMLLQMSMATISVFSSWIIWRVWTLTKQNGLTSTKQSICFVALFICLYLGFCVQNRVWNVHLVLVKSILKKENVRLKMLKVKIKINCYLVPSCWVAEKLISLVSFPHQMAPNLSFKRYKRLALLIAAWRDIECWRNLSLFYTHHTRSFSRQGT